MKKLYLFWKLLTVTIFVSISPDVSSQINIQESRDKTTSAFNPKSAEWEIAWPGRVSQYNLAYLSPPVDPMQGIPLGNGEVGVLFWCEDSKIIAAVNKSDLWDDAAFGPFKNWDEEQEDYSTTLRHACRIVFDFQFPVFNVMYLSDFKAKLNLADASMQLQAKSPFGEITMEAFVDHETGILFCSVNSSLNEDVPVEVAVERFGSRTYSHWYSQVNRDASIGLAGTEASSDDNGVFISQKLSSGIFAVGGSVIQSNGLHVGYSRNHSSRATISAGGKQEKNLQLAFMVTSPEEKDPVAEVKNSLRQVAGKGLSFYRENNSEIWKSIWTRSFMDYGDDYLNNLWYLTMYYANTSQGGKYPGRFNNGLWTWSRDVQNWNFYFHWNQQQLYWPLNAAGFHELVTPYLDYRFNSLPQAKKDAKEFFKTDGAFISDVTERRGFNSASELKNHTPVAEIALDFWRQYQYTGDHNFLKEKALPFMIEAARFYQSLLVKEEDGLYHAKEGTGYEGWIKLKDGLTELVYAEALFSTVLKAIKETGTDLPEAAEWKKILENLSPLPVVEPAGKLFSAEGTEYKLNHGFFKNSVVPCNKIFAAGWGIKENEMLTVYSPVEDSTINCGFKLLDGIFPSVPSSPVFPSGVIGLSQQSSPLFKIAETTTHLYGIDVMGWDPVPIVMARLGLSEELEKNLDNFPRKWQIYCNGWGHIGGESEVKKDAEWFFRTNTVRDANSKETFPSPMWPFRHMSMESMSVLATAINESLFQSYDGVLRVFPAFPVRKSGRFTLYAQDGFIVSSEIKSGEVQWICIKSLNGNPCKLQLPWEKATVQSNLKKKNQPVSGTIAEFNTKAGEVFLILQEGKKPGEWTVTPENPEENGKPKFHSSGKVQLGLPRMF